MVFIQSDQIKSTCANPLSPTTCAWYTQDKYILKVKSAAIWRCDISVYNPDIVWRPDKDIIPIVQTSLTLTITCVMQDNDRITRKFEYPRVCNILIFITCEVTTMIMNVNAASTHTLSRYVQTLSQCMTNKLSNGSSLRSTDSTLAAICAPYTNCRDLAIAWGLCDL